MSKTNQSKVGFHSLTIFAIGVALLNGYLGIYVVPLQIGAWMDGLQYSAAQSGLLGTVEVGAMSITAIIVAPLLSRWSLANVALAGALLGIVAQVITAVVDQYFLVAFARLAVGCGTGLIFAAAVAGMATAREPDRLMGFGQAVTNLLFMGFFVLIPYALSWQAHRGLFLSLAVLMFLSIPMYKKLPGMTEVTPDAETKAPAGRMGVRVLTHFVAIVLLNLGMGALWGFLERAGVQIGLSVETIGAVLSASTFAMIAGSLFAGWLGIRIGRAVPMLVASVLCGVSSLAVMTADTLIVYASAAMLYGVAYLFIGPYIIVGMGAALDPSGRLAPACGGIMFFSYSLGIGSGGYIADTFSYAAIGWFALVGSVIGGILFFVNARALGLVRPAEHPA